MNEGCSRRGFYFYGLVFASSLLQRNKLLQKNKTSLANVSRIEKAAEAWTLVLIEVRI